MTASGGFVKVDYEYAWPGARLFTSQRVWALPSSVFGLPSMYFPLVLKMMSGIIPFKQRNSASSRLQRMLSHWPKIPLWLCLEPWDPPICETWVAPFFLPSRWGVWH